jgi:CheY-like chemotaxis protein
MPEERAQCLACGMVAHVAKPIEIDRLIATLRTVTGAQRPS